MPGVLALIPNVTGRTEGNGERNGAPAMTGRRGRPARANPSATDVGQPGGRLVRKPPALPGRSAGAITPAARPQRSTSITGSICY